MLNYSEVLKPHKKHFDKHKNKENCNQCIKYLNMKEALEEKIR